MWRPGDQGVAVAGRVPQRRHVRVPRLRGSCASRTRAWIGQPASASGWWPGSTSCSGVRKEIVRERLADPADENEFNRAFAGALRLGLPVRAAIRHLREHPNNAYACQCILARATAAEAPELVSVAEEVLPLHTMATGPDTLGGRGSEFERDRTLGTIVNGLKEVPGAGLSLIRTAVSNRVVWVRRAAVETLRAWAEAAPSRFAPAATEWVSRAAAREPHDKLRMSMRKLLGPGDG
jgi:hypothetical protein